MTALEFNAKLIKQLKIYSLEREKKIALLSNIPRSSKSADLDLISSDDSEIDELEENNHVENIELADDNLNDELKEKEKRLFEMMNEDDFSGTKPSMNPSQSFSFGCNSVDSFQDFSEFKSSINSIGKPESIKEEDSGTLLNNLLSILYQFWHVYYI